MKVFLFFVVCAVFLQLAHGHGYLELPVNRASMWRFPNLYPNAIVNYNDMEYFCGGFNTQWGIHGGNCGVCGDNYGSPTPRSNENGGTFGDGIITKTYSSGTNIEVHIQLTANHLGEFTYQLCKLDGGNGLETDNCFQPLKMADGTNAYEVKENDNTLVKNYIALPAGLTCEHCVLRWHYNCGNSYGICENGQIELGCGPQETFRSCSDIAIV